MPDYKRPSPLSDPRQRLIVLAAGALVAIPLYRLTRAEDAWFAFALRPVVVLIGFLFGAGITLLLFHYGRRF